MRQQSTQKVRQIGVYVVSIERIEQRRRFIECEQQPPIVVQRRKRHGQIRFSEPTFQFSCRDMFGRGGQSIGADADYIEGGARCICHSRQQAARLIVGHP